MPTAEITSPSSTDFPLYAERVEAPPERPVPEEGAESLWWDAFHSGEIERVHEAIIALDEALEADPENDQLLFARIGANT